MRKLLLSLLLGIVSFSGFGQMTNQILNTKIRYDQERVKVSRILEDINKIEGSSVVYNASDELLSVDIELSAKEIRVEEGLDIICKKLPFEYSEKDGYIIFKRKAIEDWVIFSGRTIEEGTGEPVIAANVYIPEVKKGMVSGLDGRFSFRLKPGIYTIQVTFVGYRPVEKKIFLFGDMQLDLKMKSIPMEISEVEIVSKRLRNSEQLVEGRNIEILDKEELKMVNVNMTTDVFQGRINGMWATKMSGAPGEHQKIHVRGINSLFASTDPLFVVDGLPIPNVNLNSLGIADLNIRDIENIKVLKDASSTAFYGYQGANGVVLIETKRRPESRLTFSTRQGIQFFNKRLPLMDTEDFLTTARYADSLINPVAKRFYKTYSGFTQTSDPINGLVTTYEDVDRYVFPLYHDSLNLKSRDYQDVMFQNGYVREYQLGAGGSLLNTDYYLSGNIFNHDGIVRNTSYRRLSFAANLRKQFSDRAELLISYRLSRQENRNNLDSYMGNKTILKSINIEPEYESLSSFEKMVYRPYLPAGTPDNPKSQDMIRSIEINSHKNESVPLLYIGEYKDPVDFLNKDRQSHDLNIHSLSGSLSMEVFPGLIYDTRNSVSWRKNNYVSALAKYSSDGTEIENVYLRSPENYMIMNHSSSLSYTRSVKNHNFLLSATYRKYVDLVEWKVDSLYNIDIDGIDKTSDGYIKGSNAVFGKSGDIVRSINSMIGHFRYDYRKTLTASFFLNSDHLEEGDNVNVSDLFPSMALNWKLAGSKIGKSFFTDLNLFFNWGKTGNYPLNGLSNDLYNDVTADLMEEQTTGIYISNLANHYLVHEELTEKNFGARASFFNSSLELSADYFMKKNRNLIVERDIPYYYGGGKYMYNIGELESHGIEVSMEMNLHLSGNMSVLSKFGISANMQSVRKINNTLDTLFFNDENIMIPGFEIIKNRELGIITGYKYEGRWTDEDAANKARTFVNSGGFKYLNQDTTDRKITENDRLIIGNSIPDFTCFWNNSILYRNLRVDFLWYGVIGVDKFNATRASTYFTGRNAEVKEFVSDTIKPHMSDVFYQSSYFIEDASFIRLKSLTFSYSPEKPIYKNVNASFSVSFENLLTITRYSGYDPESSIYTDNNFSDQAIDYGAYPSPKGIYFGIDMSF